MPAVSHVVVRSAELQRFCADVFVRVGVTPADATIAATVIVEADLRGVHTRGTVLLPSYVSKLRAGGINPRPRPHTVRETTSTVLVDGDHGLGHVLAGHAMALAMARAAATGIAAVGVRNASHFGAAASYSMLAVQSRQIGIAMCNTVACMPPNGGLSPVIGNNPISVAVPAGQYPPIVLDMALSTVAWGKIAQAARRGEKIPFGWALDRSGVPTNDPIAGMQGLLLPMGGVKGFGLAVVVEALAGVLTGAGFGSDIPLPDQPDRPELVGFFLAAIDIAAFMPVDEFTARVDALASQVKAATPLPDGPGIFLPGELEHLTRQRQLTEGILLDSLIWQDLGALAKALALALPEGLECSSSVVSREKRT
jgi:LDH2 family malate/lactate/ureidoglycolate dehydrogenase